MLRARVGTCCSNTTGARQESSLRTNTWLAWKRLVGKCPQGFTCCVVSSNLTAYIRTELCLVVVRLVYLRDELQVPGLTRPHLSGNHVLVRLFSGCFGPAALTIGSAGHISTRSLETRSSQTGCVHCFSAVKRSTIETNCRIGRKNHVQRASRNINRKYVVKFVYCAHAPQQSTAVQTCGLASTSSNRTRLRLRTCHRRSHAPCLSSLRSFIQRNPFPNDG